MAGLIMSVHKVKVFCFMTNRAEPFEGVDESRKNYGAFMTLSSTLTYRRLTKTEQKAYDRLKEWFEQLTGRKDARTRQLLLAAKAFATVKFF